MRRIKKREAAAAGNIYCPYCKKEDNKKVPAVWRLDGHADYKLDFSCDSHKGALFIREKERNNKYSVDDLVQKLAGHRVN